MEMKYLKNVATLRLDENRCTGCGLCVQVCPHAVFEIENRKAEGVVTSGRRTAQKQARIVDLDRCMECGACAMNCAFDAISVNAGVGCAAAIIHGTLHGTEPSCGCGGTEKPCCG